MNYSEILARLRKERGLTQSEVADYITGQTGKKCSNASVSSWEKGVALPHIHQFLLLCELYGVRDIQAAFREIETQYKSICSLNALGKSRVEEYISMLLGNSLFTKVADEAHSNNVKRYIKLFDIPVAAGFGEHLDDSSYEDLEVDDTVPEEADFAVRVSGDSMAPRFVDGQVVFVKEQQTLEVGDIGIFSHNGDAYIKKLGRGELISLNESYLTIPINEFDSLHIFGKVVG